MLTPAQPKDRQPQAPIFHNYDDAFFNFSLRLCSHYDAIAPLYKTGTSNVNQKTTSYQKHLPLLTSIKINGKSLPQLFIDGCAFNSVYDHGIRYNDETIEIGRYPDDWSNFKYQEYKQAPHTTQCVKGSPKKCATDQVQNFHIISSPLAVIGRLPKPNGHGGTFLSGTHFEACGETSAILDHYKDKLAEDDLITLQQNESQSIEILSPIIREHIGLGRSSPK
jgi:hypothetical protein